MVAKGAGDSGGVTLSNALEIKILLGEFVSGLYERYLPGASAGGFDLICVGFGFGLASEPVDGAVGCGVGAVFGLDRAST